MKKSLKILVIAAFVFVAYLFCSIALFSTVDQKKTADAAIILGAAAWHNRPSPVFQERIRHGIWLYENGYVGKLILTGGKSKNAPFSEAYVARPVCPVARHTGKRHPDRGSIPDHAGKPHQRPRHHGKKRSGNRARRQRPYAHETAMQIAGDLGITAWSSPTPTTRYESFRAKVLFLVQETWHMIGYIIYPNGLPEWPAPGNGS